MLLFEKVLGASAFIFLLVGLVFVLLPHVNEWFHNNKKYLSLTTNVCAATTLVWIAVSLFMPGLSLLSGTFILTVVLLFGWLSLHFSEKSNDLTE